MLHPHASRKRRIAVPPLEPKTQSTRKTGRSLTLAHLARSNNSPRTHTHRPRTDAMMTGAALLTVDIMVTRLRQEADPSRFIEIFSIFVSATPAFQQAVDFTR